MTSECLFILYFSPFLPEFTCFAPKIVLNIKTIFGAKQVNSGKNGEKLEFVTSGVELLWGNCTVFLVQVQGILTGGT